MSILSCPKCDGKMHLDYARVSSNKADSKVIQIENVPVLKCGKCGEAIIPRQTQECMDYIIDYVLRESSKDEEVVEIDFNLLKQRVLVDKFISEKVKFVYDKDDYYFIPGLVRPWKTGFLTPVFFNIEVLLKYMHHPNYDLDIGANTFGVVYKDDEHYFDFGINENDKVIIWLGDIISLSLEEQFYLRSENTTSDHSISSEFYEAQIETQWAEAASEKKLLAKRLAFNEKMRNEFGISIAQLDTETVRVSKNIQKMIVNTEDAFKDLMIPMNELFVEAINNKDIRSYLKRTYPEEKEEFKEKKGIKLLQFLLTKNTTEIDVNKEIAPLFVLYDLRLVSAHLYPDEDREKLLSSCCERLDLSADERNYMVIASTLVEKLDRMYDVFNEHLKIDCESEENE